MRRKLFSFIVGLLGLTLVFLSLLLIRARPERSPSAFPDLSVAQSSGTEEDPRALWEWEQMCFRDPTTGKIPFNIRARELAFIQSISNAAAARKTSQTLVPDWKSRGPWNVGGRTRALAVDITNPNIIFAGSINGGLWRSEDGGRTWARVTGLDEATQSIACITQDPRPGKTHIWYFGTGEFNFWPGNGIYKSTDGGLTWEQLPSTEAGPPSGYGSPFQYVSRIVIDPSNTSEDVVYAATHLGIMRSEDGGATWERHLGVWWKFSDVTVTSDGVVYAGMVKSYEFDQTVGIWRSTNGTEWTKLTTPTIPESASRVDIEVAPSDQDLVYVLIDAVGVDPANTALWRYRYLSGDGADSGGEWSNRTANLPRDLSPYGIWSNMLRIHPENEDVVYVGRVRLFRSTDGFATKGHVEPVDSLRGESRRALHVDHHELLFSPTDPRIVYEANDGGVYRTANTAENPFEWESLNNGYLTTEFYSVAIDLSSDASGDHILVGGTQDNGTYFVNDESSTAPWRKIWGGDGGFAAISEGRQYYYVSHQNGGIIRWELDDSGRSSSWAQVDPEGARGYLFINPFMLDPNDNNRMYVPAGSYLWRNDFLPEIPNFSWEPTSVGWERLNNTFTDGFAISALDVSHVPANTVYYGTRDGKLFRVDNAHNNASVPQEITAPSFHDGAYINAIAIDPTNADQALVAFSNYNIRSLFYTRDGGLTWEHVSGNLEEHPDGSGAGPATLWTDILPLSEDVNLYLVGTSTGLYSTLELNGAATFWTPEGADIIGNVTVSMIQTRLRDRMIAVATKSSGIYSGSVSPTVVTAERFGDEIPNKFALEQNYPNPFNPVTTIRYDLPIASDVTVKVYNLMGQEVATLLSGSNLAGPYTITWDATGFASGVYVYSLKAGSYVETKKMLLLK